MLSPTPSIELQLQALLEATDDGVIITDGQGVILAVNPSSEALNSFSGEDFLGRNVDALVEEGIVDRSVTREVLRLRRQTSFIQHVNGIDRYLQVTGTPSLDARGNIRLVVVIERDVTDLRNMRATVEEAQRAKKRVQEELTERNLMETGLGEVVAESKEMRQALTTSLKLARLETSEILLLGESGTGKGLMAKFLHRNSPRAGGPFVQINCAALPENLFEAELFGYERGAFTGASETGKAGLIELARGGTFFFDEVGEIPLEIQAKLLKCLDDHEFYPLGAKRPRKVDCVFIAATNRDLEDLVRRRRFREDLYYRLNTFTVRLPPLRKRPEDIFELATQYLRHFNEQFGVSKRLSHNAMTLLQSYPFPGNVRELIGIIKKAVVISEEDLLDDYLESLLLGAPEGYGQTHRIRRSLPRELDALERELLSKARTACGTTRRMAEYLGISQPSVVRKLRKHGLAPDS